MARDLFLDFTLAFNYNPAGALIGQDGGEGGKSLSDIFNSYSQCCVSSPFIFTFYTDDCRTDGPDTFILKFSDDTVLLSLLGTKDDPRIHTDRMVEWCEKNSLIINAKKTKEFIFGLPESLYPPPVIINNTDIEQVFSYKYLGIHVDAALSWSAHIDYICGKMQQRIYFLRRLRSFGTSKSILLLFFQFIVPSVMQYGVSAWYSCLSVQLKARLGRLLSIRSKTVGQTPEPIFKAAYARRILSLEGNILHDPTHFI